MKFTDLYKLITEGRGDEIRIRGEYWFDENGNTMYADGDVGDMNHEMHVEQMVTGSILNYFGLDMDEFRSLELSEYYDDIKEELKGDLDLQDEDAVEEFEDSFDFDPKQFIEDYIVKNFKEPREKISKMLYMRDAREYAIKEWNWSRVHGNNIEVNRLTKDQLNRVSSGIWSALDEEGSIFSDEEREIAGQTDYYISTYTGKSYTIKLDDMDSPENVSNLEETPVVHKPGFSNIDSLDKSALNDFYKDKPMGDSFETPSHYSVIK